ncbi:MAG: hypothetical protein ACRC5T_00165 [Cetobacterium sp.]
MKLVNIRIFPVNFFEDAKVILEYFKNISEEVILEKGEIDNDGRINLVLDIEERLCEADLIRIISDAIDGRLLSLVVQQ